MQARKSDCSRTFSGRNREFMISNLPTCFRGKIDIESGFALTQTHPEHAFIFTMSLAKMLFIPVP